MVRHIHLATYLRVADLEQRYRAAYEPYERSWWQILWPLGRGQPATASANITAYSPYGSGQIAQRYTLKGQRACAISTA